MPRIVDAQTTRSRGPVNVVDFGAAGDGVSDDTAAVQAALDAAAASRNGTYFPCGVYGVTKPLEVSSPVRLEDCATIRALAPMNAVVEIGSAGYVRDGWFRGGVIDANDLADDGLFLRQFAHLNVADTEIFNARLNGFHLGDPTLSGSSYEAVLTGVHTRRTMGLAQPGSAGLLVDATAADINVSNAIFTGSDAGVRTMTGGNFFTDIHVWSPRSVGWMTVGFDDYGSGNFWKGCEADTVLLWGLHAHRFNTIVEGCRFYNNSIYGQDNTAIGMMFDQSSPYATIVGDVFVGQDSSHRLALDIQVADSSNMKLFGNQYVNVSQHH
jgi:hypothetical protein